MVHFVVQVPVGEYHPSRQGHCPQRDIANDVLEDEALVHDQETRQQIRASFFPGI